MFALAAELPGRVVMTTTTRIFAAQIEQAPAACALSEPGWREAIVRGGDDILLVGETTAEHGLGIPPELPRALLALDSVAHVIVEADGSRMRPVKAPAAHEPVIPDATTLLVVVAGLDALEGPLGEVAHRPELVAELTGTPLDRPLTPEALALLLTHPQGGLKNLPPHARAAIVLNKADTPDRRELAQRVAKHVQGSGVDRVLVTALRSGQLFAEYG